jgi:hypothetical protein
MGRPVDRSDFWRYTTRPLFFFFNVHTNVSLCEHCKEVRNYSLPEIPNMNAGIHMQPGGKNGANFKL